MSNVYLNKIDSGAFKRLRIMLIGLVVLVTAGCGPGSGDGVIFDQIVLPTDLVLNLRCANVGIYLETCVLLDVENPYRNVAIGEFDENNPDAPIGKLELLAAIPAGSTGAKARFYLWATALARRASGENQYGTARALHELWTAQVANGFGDPLIQEQAKTAYRAVLEFFFGAVVFFKVDFINPPPDPDIFYSVIVSDLVGQNLFNLPQAPGNFDPLWPDPDPVVAAFQAKEAMSEWGFTYDDANKIVFVNM